MPARHSYWVDEGRHHYQPYQATVEQTDLDQDVRQSEVEFPLVVDLQWREKNWISGYRLMSNLSVWKTIWNKRIWPHSFPISQKQYVWRPTHSPWCVHNFNSFFFKNTQNQEMREWRGKCHYEMMLLPAQDKLSHIEYKAPVHPTLKMLINSTTLFVNHVSTIYHA